jgi:hypothetical protein
MRSPLIALLLAGLPFAYAVGCGGGDDEASGAATSSSASTTTSATTGAGGAGGASEGEGGEGIGEVTCEPPCVAPQVCSVTNVCIDEGTCLVDGDCCEGLVCDLEAMVCAPGGECGGTEATIESIPPNLLIVLDRSCSMNKDSGNGTTKWEIAVAAINQMTTSFDAQIRFGLTLFPDHVTPDCQQAEIPIPVDPAAVPPIQALLTAALDGTDANFPKNPCVTNIDTAMQQAATEPAFQDPERESFALLITDGQQSGNCNAAGGDAGTLQIITDLATAGVPTFVVGFGSGVDSTQLNEFADAGGVPSADPTNHFYIADDQASLDAALLAIATSTLSCTFTLGEVPPDPSEIYVFFDNDPTGIANDATHTEGWDYDPVTNQVTFYGLACESIRSNAVSDVDIVFGCDEPTPM